MLMVSICCYNEYLIFSDIYLNDETDFFFPTDKSWASLKAEISSCAQDFSVQKER